MRSAGIARRWTPAPTADRVRQALLGLGDARLAQADTTEAMDLYQSVMDRGTSTDSLGNLAARRLLSLGVTLPGGQP